MYSQLESPFHTHTKQQQSPIHLPLTIKTLQSHSRAGKTTILLPPLFPPSRSCPTPSTTTLKLEKRMNTMKEDGREANRDLKLKQCLDIPTGHHLVVVTIPLYESNLSFHHLYSLYLCTYSCWCSPESRDTIRVRHASNHAQRRERESSKKEPLEQQENPY